MGGEGEMELMCFLAFANLIASLCLAKLVWDGL